MMEKEMIVIPVCVHTAKAKLMRMIISGKADINKLTLREIGDLVGIAENEPQKVKHHLEQLVSMGTLEKRVGNYYFDREAYDNMVNKNK